MLIDRVKPDNKVEAFGFEWPSALHYRGSVLRLILLPVIIMSGYATGIAFLIRKYEYLQLPITILTPVSVVLSLLLVFRTNSAYDRYWEGRKIWQDLKVNSRTMIRNIWCSVTESSMEDHARKQQALKNIAAFMISIKHYIRGEDGLDYSDYNGLLSHEFRMQVLTQGSTFGYGSIGSTCKNSRNSSTRGSTTNGGSSSELSIQQQEQGCESWRRSPEIPLPSVLLYEIQKYSEYLMDSGSIHGQMYVNMVNVSNAMGTLLGGCERILSTPIPLAYQIHLHHSLYLYLLILPWALGPLGLAKAIILQFAVSFMMVGIDAISREIQNPFGYDANDLDLDAFCEAMLVELNYALTNQSPKGIKSDTNSSNSNLAKGKSIEIIGINADSGEPDCGTLAHRRPVPTRKGRAADLIQKFNQLATPSNNSASQTATVGRASASTRCNNLRQLFSTPAAEMAASGSATDKASIARDSTHGQTQEKRSVGASQDDLVLRQSRQSVFLSDSELDRALSEIREFSKNMNISLGDDDVTIAA
ncbi:hypothetical protein IWW36_003769 [Coemansia brasiliensis]|uniref:Uncharacterized protein n=1 Tax=Coemansia brasiliensis TaxID=2650707 RepID=A0A9W8LZF7_9FUNG|nr:hypothetical protein IWW36_003769 [Coemansia brasiliensis]